MKCSALLRLLLNKGWYPVAQKGSHLKLKHDKISGFIIFPRRGSQELGEGLERKIKKAPGLK
jgi:predicted RNA binding protein YcfA (HicA-like mRNA interferase family)